MIRTGGSIMSTFSRSGVRLHAALMTLLPVLLAIPALGAAASPVTVEPVAGGGQVGVLNQAFPLTLTARVVDAAGVPIPNVSVSFEVDFCVSTLDDSLCPSPSAYPFFEGPSEVVVVQTDANGEATTAPLTAGESAGYFQVVAWVSDSGNFIGFAYFPLRQVESLAAIAIGPGFTGAWYDPLQSGHGVLLEVLPGDRLVAYWFAFTPDGAEQAWFGGAGAIVDNQAVIYADRGRGGRWIPSFDPALFALEPWGTLTFTFSDCNHGRVDFYGAGNSSPWGAGSMDLTRLTLPAGLSCP
jgi:hypothetical protein